MADSDSSETKSSLIVQIFLKALECFLNIS